MELLGANPTKITFIGTGYGAHVAANAIALYESDSGDGRSFARLVAIDPLTTDYGILSESAQASSNLYLRAAAKCSQIDLYRASWSRSLTHADQLFGDYNFALWPEGGFRADTLGNEWDRSDAALAWFTSTVTNSTDYADLGFNFDGGNAWHALTGATEPPPAGTFAGVIDGHYLELADYVSNRGADVAARYAATMRMTGSATNVMENLFGHLAGTIDYAVADDASLDASGKSVTFTVSNVADNVAIPYDALSIFSPKPFYPWRRGVSLGVWLVDLTALSAKVSAAELESADGAGLAAILRANGGEAFARRVGELWVDDPSRFVTPLDSESFSVPVRVRSDCFGAGRTIGETTLLLAAGVMSGSEGLPSVYEGDLDTANNFARLNATPVVVPFFAEVSINGQNVVTGAVMEVSANADGSWTASLAGGQTEDTNGNAIHYDFHVAPETAGCEVAVTSAGATGATLTGALASGLVEGRYTVTVTARNGTVADDDALAFTLVVTREVTAVGESKDTYATVQDGPLTAYIRMLDEETPEVTWQTNIVGRTYTVKGKATLADEEWVAPTNSTHRFFRVFADPVSVTPRTP